MGNAQEAVKTHEGKGKREQLQGQGLAVAVNVDKKMCTADGHEAIMQRLEEVFGLIDIAFIAEADRYNQISRTATAPRDPKVACSWSADPAATLIPNVPPIQITPPMPTATRRARVRADGPSTIR